MQLDNFFETHDVAAPLGKVKRILVYPNITWSKDLRQDSYIQVIHKMIKNLNEIRSDLWFYLLQPERLEIFGEFSNVTQWIYNLPSYPNQMRLHFDTEVLLKYLTEAHEFDLVFSHLPEHTLQLSNLLNNKTHFHHIPFIGYCHWFETKDVTKYAKTVFPINLLGILEMHQCFVNTDYQKDLVIKESGKWFNKSVQDGLDAKINIFKLGVDECDIVKTINKNTDKVIVYNHRPQRYKGFDEFMVAMDKLYEKRQDFKVWIPLLETPNRPYVLTTKYKKKEYYAMLRNCRVGVCMPQTHGGWSVSATDGLMNGCPFIFSDEPYYHELQSSADFFTPDTLLDVLEDYLDDNDYRNETAQHALRFCRSHLLYKDSITQVSQAIDLAIADTRLVSIDADGYKRILSLIKRKGAVSKKEIMNYLQWGHSFDWAPYRKRLSNNPNILETISEMPYYHYVETNNVL